MLTRLGPAVLAMRVHKHAYVRTYAVTPHWRSRFAMSDAPKAVLKAMARKAVPKAVPTAVVHKVV